MDVHCKRCGEPYDSYHMKFDEIWETDLREELCKVFHGQLTPMYRNALEKLGWKFGGTVFNIKQCPACCDQDMEEPDNELEEVIEELCGDDLDAIQTEIEDLQY